MAWKASGDEHGSYWERRIRSRAFKRELAATLTREITALSAERVRDVLDPRLLRAFIEQSARLIDRTVVADLIIEGNRRMNRRSRRRGKSVLDMLDPQLVDDVDALLGEAFELSPQVEELVASILQQEFVRRLFTDIIFTAIVSFNQRVNPLFGAIAMRVMEEQIKGFIHFFMPTLQQRATAFATNRQNQRILLDFTRSIIREMLDQPWHDYVVMASPAQRAQTEKLIRKAVGNAKLDALIRKGTLAAWDDLYAAIRDKPIGELLRLEENSRWLAEHCVEIIVPALRRPHIRRFVAAEMRAAPPGVTKVKSKVESRKVEG
jgi:hypothetical protein